MDGSDYVSIFELFRHFLTTPLDAECVNFNSARKEQQMAAENGLRPETRSWPRLLCRYGHGPLRLSVRHWILNHGITLKLF